MNFIELVMPGDVVEAERNYACFIDCLKRAVRSAKDLDFNSEAHWKLEADRCREELQRLIKVKSQYDHLDQFVSNLKGQGVTAELITINKKGIDQYV